MAIWNDEIEDQFISLIQERPALYDITDKLYANRIVKTGLWREIETQLVLPEKELRKKWDSLRTQYTRYKKLAPSGSSGAPKTGRQQWILARLQFLRASAYDVTVPSCSFFCSCSAVSAQWSFLS
ncbi:transcription factor Adf-1-like [Notothenia coriiceps]|uniref:Transcription factor Adf-1-like n=1 Tax=Notothenia coriiceps TaxID=8208 RepID=A0A6I9N011_9TELE|nr:PREDICTED: transcription factor Adf-1-like [Notothenia coriiceps]